MNRGAISRQISQQRQRVLQQTLEALQKDPNSDVSNDLQRLKHYNQLLAEIASTGKRWNLTAIGFAIICMVAAGLLAVCKWPSCHITLDLQAERVAISLNEALPPLKSPIVMSRIILTGFSAIDLPYPHPALASAYSDARFEANGDKIILDELSIAKSANIEVETINGRPELFISNGQSRGRLLLSGKTSLRAGEEGSEVDAVASEQNYEGSEAVTFGADGAIAVPATIELFGPKPLVLHDLAVSMLRFGRQIPLGQPIFDNPFESTIITANITINETERKTFLQQGEELRLDRADGIIRTMRVDDKVHLTFEGTVKGIEAGPRHFLRNLTPTWLEYFYHQKTMGFIWSAMAFFWGFIWSFKKIIFK